MVKVLWLSDLVSPTGFARVSHSIIKYLPKDDYEIFGLGVNYFGDPHDYDFKIFPAKQGNPADIYGFGRLGNILDFVQPELIFCLNDAWIQTSYLKVIKKYYLEEHKKPLPRIVTYTPIDAEDHNSDWYEDFDIVTLPVAYTNFGKQVIIKATDGKIVPKIILHGVDTETFYKLEESKLEQRKKVFDTDESENYFVVLNANRNQPRKRLDISMKAFALFAEGKDDVRYYAHCGIIDSHIDILRMAGRLKIDTKLIISGMQNNLMALPSNALNEIYNVSDVGLNTGLGEGFGLVNIEHAATGAPQIVGRHSALEEVHEGSGLFIDVIAEWTIDKISTTGKIVSVEDTAEQLNKLYSDKDLFNQLSQKALEKFTSKEYSWRYISKQWDNLFKSIL